LNDEARDAVGLERKVGEATAAFKCGDRQYEHRDGGEMVNVSLTKSPVHKNKAECTVEDISDENFKDDIAERKSIKIMNVTAKWTEDLPENTLTDVNLEVRPGGLVAVIGPVGSGKVSYRYSMGGAVNSAWYTELMLECCVLLCRHHCSMPS
jgi:ABC-type multidrug transport system fused ATPase/permease subunit